MNTRPTIAELTTATPTEIDTVLAAIWTDIYRAQSSIDSAKDDIRRIEKRYGGKEITFAYDADRMANAVKRQAQWEAEYYGLLTEAAPYESEYSRRPWNRYFHVDNNNGHVHNTMNCSSCYPTTQYRWLIELSGQSETECVALVGETACTVCMPSAPVMKGFGDGASGWARKSADEKAAAAAIKAEKAAAKNAKAITDVDGSPLRNDGYVIATLASAKIAMVNEMWYHKFYGANRPDLRAGYAAARDHLAAAIAHKTGETIAEVIAAAEIRLAAKIKREK